MKISVMITSRNRREDLQRTLSQLETMVPPPDEIWVTDDGSTDESAAMVKKEFPACRLRVNNPGQGSVASRDWMIRQAVGDLVVSLDDDSYPVDKDFFAKLPALIESHREAAVLCFPELCDGGFLHAHDPLYSQGHYTPSYPNCAAVMLRDVYLQAGGFPPFFVHCYEEPDFAAQCAGLGYAVWFEPSVAVRHHYSPENRDWLRLHQLQSRNELWSVFLRCPWPWLPLVAMFRISRQFFYAANKGFGWVVREPVWWLSALRGLNVCVRERRPVKWKQYLSWMKLARRPLFNQSQWREAFGEVQK